MRGNTQFPVASHILALVGLVDVFDHEKLTSVGIAESVNTNPVVIRRIVGQLKGAGLVNVKPGVGGVELTRSPKDITLLDIYKAVQSKASPSVFDLHENVNESCPVGSKINSVLSVKLDKAQEQLEQTLAQSTVYDVMFEIAEKNHVKID